MEKIINNIKDSLNRMKRAYATALRAYGEALLKGNYNVA